MGEPVGRLPEDLVAGVVAVAVVDVLEVVDVEQSHRDGVRCRVPQRGVEQLDERRAVGQSGEGVGPGLRTGDALPGRDAGDEPAGLPRAGDVPYEHGKADEKHRADLRVRHAPAGDQLRDGRPQREDQRGVGRSDDEKATGRIDIGVGVSAHSCTGRSGPDE